MASWVRYSVAVYVGLLLAGSLMASKQAAAWPWGPLPKTVVKADAKPREAPAPRYAPPSDPARPELKPSEGQQRAG